MLHAVALLGSDAARAQRNHACLQSNSKPWDSQSFSRQLLLVPRLPAGSTACRHKGGPASMLHVVALLGAVMPACRQPNHACLRSCSKPWGGPSL